MRSTIAEALRDMRRLHDVDAGRLRGEIVYLSGHSADDPVPAAQPWADNLAGLIAAGRDGTVTAGTPRYLVYSDNVVVAWLTVHAEVVAPYSPILTANQIKHQGQAAAVLAHLDRTTLFDLADERDRREGRHNPDADATDGSARRGALRAAAVGDPTRTTWVHVDADPAVTRTRIHDALGVDRGQEVFVIAAWGYGEHCYRADRVSLELVCAVHAVAADHGVTEATVGNWIADPHGLDGRPDLATLAARFRDSYIGRYPDRAGYVRSRLGELGLGKAIDDLGIGAYFDYAAYERDLFRYEALAIDPGEPRGDFRSVGGTRGIEVFRPRTGN